MNLEAFEQLWELNPLGNKELAKNEWIGAQLEHKVPAETILAKYRDYIKLCKLEKRETKYIRTIESFLKNNGWSGEYNLSTPEYIKRWLKGILSLLTAY